LLRTTTGILSNRRPISGTPITSGSATPSEPESSFTPRLSLLAMAKRESARRILYARFFKGPILGPDTNLPMAKPSTLLDTPKTAGASTPSPEAVKEKKKWKQDHDYDQEEEKLKKSKKSKKSNGKESAEDVRVEEGQTKDSTDTTVGVPDDTAAQAKHRAETREERRARKAAKAERRKQREARQKAKEELKKAKEETRRARDERKKRREERRREKELKKKTKKGIT